MGGVVPEEELGGLGVGVGDLVEGGHDAAAFVLQAPDQPEDAGHGDELGGHHAVQARSLDDGGVVHPVALGDDLADALLLGVEGGDEVVLVPAGQGDEGVVVGEMLGGQQLLIRAVAV